MRINEAYKVRQIAGENIVMIQGKDQIDLTQVISLNETSLWLWQQVANREFTPDDITALLQSRFDIDAATARADAETWIKELTRYDIIS